MYQFYYSRGKEQNIASYSKKLSDEFLVSAVRPTMWEEHCLECSAPLCFSSCTHYIARSDGRCMRFANGITVSENPSACCGRSARVRFRKWANMMTIVFPAMLPLDKLAELDRKNIKLGNLLGAMNRSKLPVSLRWQGIRTLEYLRRRRLRSLAETDNKPDAFVFHGYSFEKSAFNLIVEIFDDHTPVERYSVRLEPGENLHIIKADKLDPACAKSGCLVKVYPENDIEAELDILWCDFVKGSAAAAAPAAQVKCLVWDLDNTMWNGTLIETDDPDTLELLPGVEKTIKELDAKGILQSVASKNDFEPAMAQLKRLGVSDYFLYPQIHWDSKSGSMRAIAASLNIGLDSLALIDDSVFEREQVRSSVPEVRGYDAAELSGLTGLREFDVPVTEESRNRRQMYRAEEKRSELKARDNTDTVEFLKKCRLGIVLFSPKTEEELTRCYELTVRTNQLNMSGKKYTREEFDAILNDPRAVNFAFSCSDDFGSYGTVGFGQYRVEGGRIVFNEFAMSCRVAGKYVESALFSALLKREGCAEGIFEVLKTKKNTLLRSTLKDIGFVVEAESDDAVRYCFAQDLKHSGLITVKGE